MAATARVVDLTNVKEGGIFRPRRRPEGDYKLKIVKADDHQPKDKDKALGWVLTLQVEGDARSTYPYYLSPEANQAWKIGAICRAAGLNVKNARLKFDPNRLVNKWIGAALVDDEFEGKVKSTIDDVFPVSEVGASADEDAPEEIDEIDEDEVEIPDDEEIEEEEEEEPAPPPRKRRATAPPTKRVAKAPVEEPEDDEEEDEEEEPAPPPRKRAAATKTAAAPKRRRPAPPPVEDDEDDDLDELDTDDLD